MVSSAHHETPKWMSQHLSADGHSDSWFFLPSGDAQDLECKNSMGAEKGRERVGFTENKK